MVTSGRLLTATLAFPLLFGPGATAPGAAEPLSPVFPEARAPGAGAPDGVARDVAALPSRDGLGVPLGEPDVSGTGSAGLDAKVVVAATTGGADDGWADAHADGSRVSYAAVAAATYPVTLNPQVQYFLDRFTGSRREIVSLWVSRSGRYLGMIREVLRARGLPEDLAYTAMIESGFKPDAVSRMGAKGLWQFMAATARRYGLRVDRWVDERLDPEKSTLAAAAYLGDLYEQFGSWALAQAAYNAGEVAVARAIRGTGSRDFWTLAQTRHLRRETREFVPQIHAATLIGRDPDRYGFDFDDHDPVAVDTVTAPAATDLQRLAAAAGLPADAMRALNPALVRGVTPPGGPWALRVPAGTRERVAAEVAPRGVPVAVAAAPVEVTPAVAGGEIHVVRPRDTVSAIAKRYGVSVGDVLRWNRLESQDRIRPGDRLRVDAARSADREGR
jgi:membrane-bound lytic murein transglycosylase D